MINAVLTPYDCVFKRSSKPVMKGSMVVSDEEMRKKQKNLLEESLGKT